MFKRANKVTALLVAAASIMSIVPAMATTRLGVKDGHIKDGAIAFEDGKYVYDGYRTDEDDNGIYYNDGTDAKEELNDDLKDYELAGRYGTKYVYATDNNGKDQYLIDLTTGKIVDDETPEDKADTVKSKLKSTLKKTDRYANTGSWDTVSLGDSAEAENYNADTRILADRFGEVWYKYTAAGDSTTQSARASFTLTLPVYTVASPYVAGTSSFTAGNFTITSTATQTVDQFKDAIVAALKADPTVTAVFDSNLILLNAGKTVITGYARTTGQIAKTDANLVAFANKYGAVLSEAEVKVTTASAASMNLGTLSTATSYNTALVLTRITTTSEVELLSAGLGKADTTTVDVKDTAGNVATLTVSVTTTGGIKVTNIKKYFTEAQKAAAFTLVSNAGTLATASSAELRFAFEALDLTKYVEVNSDASTTKLTALEARDAILKYIQTGIKGAFAVDTDTLKVILQNALDKKTAANATTIPVTVDRGASSAQYTGFVSESGKYIDVSNLANIYVYSKTEGKTVKIKEYSKKNTDYNITVSLQSIDAIAQDEDYIYTLTKVAVLEDGYAETNQVFIQKISKAQGDKKDGAYLPKSVDSYQVDNKSIYDDGDSQVAYNFLVNGVEDGFTFRKVTVKDGNLYITGTKVDKVKVFKISLKKGKKDLMAGVPKGKKDGKAVDVYIADKSADSDHDVKSGTTGTAVTWDAAGNTWIIHKGTITKFDGTDKKDMYTTDRSFTQLNVYDDNNLIAWDADTDVYTNVGEGTKVTADEATAVAPEVKTGWQQLADGSWNFNDTTGVAVTSKWINVGGAWYYLKADGVMATGWYNDNGTWYYLNASGAMATGWLNDNGTWYYLSGSGAMLANTTVDGYVLGASGAWIK